MLTNADAGSEAAVTAGDPRAVPERPIFLLGAGWRTGSTLAQRLLCSHPEVVIWGENRGLLAHLDGALRVIEGLQPLSEAHRQKREDEGGRAWIAVLNPDLNDFEAGLRQLLLRYYAEPARRAGHSRWGFKEVRHELEQAQLLRRLFPAARFLLLVRHPEDCLASARGTMKEGRGLLKEVGGPEEFVSHWTRLAASFHAGASQPGNLLIRYEDMVAEPDRIIARIGEFLDLDASGFDRSVFEHRIGGWRSQPRLEAIDRELLRAPALWQTAERFGYAPRQLAPASLGQRVRDTLGRLSGATPRS
jgi:hypothetical protein